MATVTRPRVEQTRPVELVDWARRGRLRIPSFQRSFRWEREDVVKLFDSVLRGYPVGTLLMWRRPAAAARLEIGPLAVDAPEAADAYWVVDGQQRVTSLVGALAAPDDTVDPRFRIFYDLEAGRFVSAGRREPVPEHWFPVRAALSNVSVLAWHRDRPWITDAELDRCDDVIQAIRDYLLPVYVVTGDDEHAVREMFDRLNNSGHRLTQAEIFDALHTVTDQMEPSNLAALAAAVKGFGFGEIPDRILVRSVLAIRHGHVDRDFRREFRDDADRQEAFKKTEHALGVVVDFLRDEVGIPHARVLPYMLFVPVLTRFVALFGPPEGRAAELLRRWVWRGSAVGVAPQGTTLALRQNALAVAEDPVLSADRLLRLLPREAWLPDPRAFRLHQPQAKLNLLALLSRRPRILATPPGAESRVGAPIDPVWLLQQGWNPLVTVTTSEDWRRETIASRLVHPRDVPDRAIRKAIGRADAEILRSHFIDEVALRDLPEHENFFLVRRFAQLETAIEEHVQENALFGFPDGPELVRPE